MENDGLKCLKIRVLRKFSSLVVLALLLRCDALGSPTLERPKNLKFYQYFHKPYSINSTHLIFKWDFSVKEIDRAFLKSRQDYDYFSLLGVFLFLETATRKVVYYDSTERLIGLEFKGSNVTVICHETKQFPGGVSLLIDEDRFVRILESSQFVPGSIIIYPRKRLNITLSREQKLALSFTFVAAREIFFSVVVTSNATERANRSDMALVCRINLLKMTRAETPVISCVDVQGAAELSPSQYASLTLSTETQVFLIHQSNLYVTRLAENSEVNETLTFIENVCANSSSDQRGRTVNDLVKLLSGTTTPCDTGSIPVVAIDNIWTKIGQPGNLNQMFVYKVLMDLNLVKLLGLDYNKKAILTCSITELHLNPCQVSEKFHVTPGTVSIFDDDLMIRGWSEKGLSLDMPLLTCEDFDTCPKCELVGQLSACEWTYRVCTKRTSDKSVIRYNKCFRINRFQVNETTNHFNYEINITYPSKIQFGDKVVLDLNGFDFPYNHSNNVTVYEWKLTKAIKENDFVVKITRKFGPREGSMWAKLGSQGGLSK